MKMKKKDYKDALLISQLKKIYVNFIPDINKQINQIKAVNIS